MERKGDWQNYQMKVISAFATVSQVSLECGSLTSGPKEERQEQEMTTYWIVKPHILRNTAIFRIFGFLSEPLL